MGLVLLVDRVLWVAAVLLPLAGGVTAGLARWRVGRGVSARTAWLRSVAEVGMIVGTAPWLILGMWPIEVTPDVIRWRTVPFTDIAAQLSGPSREAFVQIGANLLVFFGLGLFAPIRFAEVAGAARLLALGAISSLTLELCQQVFGTGRVFSVDDILLNAVGCVLGGLITSRWWLGGTAELVPASDLDDLPSLWPR